MKLLINYYGDHPVYIEGFSKECERSCRGALHVLPKKVMTITNDEYAHIKKNYSYVIKKLRIVATKKEARQDFKIETAKPKVEVEKKPEKITGKSKRKK